jgi:hypothetical protein
VSLTDACHLSRVFGDSEARIGYALQGSGIVVLDCDGVVDARTGILAHETELLIDGFGSYTELSPSGLGVHILLAADLDIGNRRIPGLEVLTDGFVTITGHPVRRGAILSGGDALHRIVRALPPVMARTEHDLRSSLPTPMPHVVRALIDRAMPNARFRKLWAGDWSGYPSPSEADAAFAMHLARNGGDVACIAAALRQSGLARPKLRRDDYVSRTALFAISAAEVRVPIWTGKGRATDPDVERQARQRLEESALCADTALLMHVAAYIETYVKSGETPEPDGYWRVSPQYLVGDYPGSHERIMTRRGALKALRRLADAGILALRPGAGDVRIGGTTRRGKITLVQVSGTDIPSIVEGFLRQAGNKTLPPVYVVGTGVDHRNRLYPAWAEEHGIRTATSDGAVDHADKAGDSIWQHRRIGASLTEELESA